MKRPILILILIFFLILIVEVASAATVKVPTRNFTSEPTIRRRVTLTLAEQGPVTAPPWLIAGDSVAAFTDTNGIAWFSNVLAANYTLAIAGTPGRSFPMSIPDTNGIVDAAVFVNSTNANASYYTAAQVDALLTAAGNLTTNIVQQLTTAGATNAQNAANATNLYPSGPLSVNFNGGTLTSGNSTMNASGFTVNNGGSLTPSGFTGGGLNLTNVSGLATGATNAAGKTIATTDGNITGTASGLDATGLASIDTRRKNSLESGTNNYFGNGNYLTNGNGMPVGFGQYSAQHQNLGKTPRLHSLIYSNAPIRILFIGDDAFHPEAALCSAFTNAGYSFNGSALSSTPVGIGNYLYQTAVGSYVSRPVQGLAQQDSNSDPLTSFGILRLANGASVTNISGIVNGWDTTTIPGMYYVTNTGGTVGIYTNAYGQPPVLCTTIDTAAGTAGWRQTNIALPALVKDCVVSYRSVGDNIVQGFGQWNTNLGAGIRVDVRTGGNIGFADFTANAALSNYTRVLLSDYDVLVVSDLGASLEGTNLFNLIQANNLDVDVITSSFVQRDNGGQASRRESIELGRLTPFIVVDAGALMTPTNPATLTKFYDGNESHLNLYGHTYFGNYMVNTLQWGPQYWATYGRSRQTNYFFIPAQELRNESGAVTLTHIYSVFGTPYRAWGLRVAAGTYGASSTFPYPGSVLGDSKRVYARFRVLTTNAVTANTAFRFYSYPTDVNITNIQATWSLSSGSESGNFTLGNSGQTNFTATPWQSVTPGSRGPWNGWITIGFGSTSKAYDCFVLGVDLRTDPQDRIGW